MWNLYIEVIAILTIITIILGLLALYIINNVHIIQLCQATNITTSLKSNNLIILTNPEYITVTLYNICYIKNILVYNLTIITTPAEIYVNNLKNCIIALVTPGNITIIGEKCKTKSNNEISIYISPCGIYTTTPNCKPWIDIALYFTKNELCYSYVKSSFKLAEKWCTGVPELYIWAGGLIKGVIK